MKLTLAQIKAVIPHLAQYSKAGYTQADRLVADIVKSREHESWGHRFGREVHAIWVAHGGKFDAIRIPTYGLNLPDSELEATTPAIATPAA